MNAKRGVEEPRTYTYTHTRIYTYIYILVRTPRTCLIGVWPTPLAHSLAHSSLELIDLFPSYQRFAQGIPVSR